MCNNLLQFAHVYAWAREHGRSVMSMRFSYKYPFFNITHSRFVSFPLYLFAKFAAALRLLTTVSYKHAEFDPEELEQQIISHRHVVVSGWYVRWYDLFLKYRADICDLFQIDQQYKDVVREKMEELERPSNSNSNTPILRLGVHVRRGDYAQWKDGIYCYDDETYASHINRFAEFHSDKEIHVYLSSNDPLVKEEIFQSLCSHVHIHFLAGNVPEDLYMLSECDYLIGPPSTFSLVAAMYRDIPLYRMDTADAMNMTTEGFRLFDYWFRRII